MYSNILCSNLLNLSLSSITIIFLPQTKKHLNEDEERELSSWHELSWWDYRDLNRETNEDEGEVTQSFTSIQVFSSYYCIKIKQHFSPVATCCLKCARALVWARHMARRSFYSGPRSTKLSLFSLLLTLKYL